MVRELTPEEAMVTLDNTQAAARCQVKPQTLRVWRHLGKGPRFIRLSNNGFGRVRYRLSDVEAWLDERTYTSTAQEAAKQAREEAAAGKATV